VKKFSRGIYLLFLVLIINFLNKYTNFAETINTSTPSVDINEEYIIYNEKDEKNSDNKDINKIDLNDLRDIGISLSKINKIKKYKSFVGSIYDIESIHGLSKKDKDTINKYYFVSETVFNKYNINDLDSKELRMLGFNKKEVEYIEYLKSKGNINSNIDLKDKVNNEILKRSIKFYE
jgi:hypothetical protein